MMVKGRFKARALALLLAMAMVLCVIFADGGRNQASAKEAGAYGAYLPTEEDDDEALAAKVVKFNNIDWYIIEDDSTAVDAGTVTLFAKEPIGVSSFNDDLNDGNWYSTSKVKGYLDGLTAGDGFFAGVADAIVTISSLTTKTFEASWTYDTAENVKLYLLSSEEASTLPRIIRKCSSADGANDNRWWLRSPGNGVHGAASVSGADGTANVSGTFVTLEFGVRPALTLNLSSIFFSSDTNTFSVYVPVSEVTLDKTEKQTIKVGDQVSFTATVSPEDATHKTVKWSVNNSNVKLYTDKACTKDVGTDATSTLTVYAKGEAIGSAKVTVTSSEDATKSASCDIKVKKRYSWEWVDGKWYEHNGTQVYEPVGSWGGDKKGTTYGDTSGWTAKNRWLKIDGKWYFFGTDKYMECDTYRQGWHLSDEGCWDGSDQAIGWKQDATGWKYMTDSETCLTNCWKKIDGKWYYFKKTGYAAQSEFVKGWWLNASCVQSDPVQCSWHKDKNGWWYGGGKWYAKNATYTIDGKAYTFDKNGYCINP